MQQVIYGRAIGQMLATAVASQDAFAQMVAGAPSGTIRPTDIVPFVRVTGPTAAVAAMSTTGTGTVDATLTVGNITFVIVDTVPTAGQIKTGASAAAFATNIAAAITANSASTLCTALADDVDIELVATTVGPAGNDIALTTDDDDIDITDPFAEGADLEINMFTTPASALGVT